MKRYLKFEVLLPISALAMTVAITVFRSLAICLAYDPAVGYYETGNLLVISANLLTAIYVFLAFALSVVSCFGKLMPSKDPLHARVTALSLGCAVALFCFDHLSSWAYQSKTDICLLLSIIVAFVGLSFCALTFLRVNTLEPVRALGALCLSLSFLLHALCHYMETSTPINGDLKTLYMFAGISAALFFLVEGKRSLSQQNGVSARYFTLCCSMLCISVGISETFAFFFKKEAFSENYTHPLLLLCVGVYAFARLLAAKVPVITASGMAEEEQESWDDEDDDDLPEGEVTEIAPQTPETKEQ